MWHAASERADVFAALAGVTYEVLPFKKTAQAVAALVPADVGLTVSVSEAKGIDATVDVACELAALGFDAAPHLAARLVRDHAHLDTIVGRLAATNVTGIFVVGGDADRPHGPFVDALGLLCAVEVIGHRFDSVGVAGYPEGHPQIDSGALAGALADKAPHATHVVTQLCFRPATTLQWAADLVSCGVDLPVRVGIPGAVSRQKLVRVAGRLGLGPSARFLLKQNGMLWRFLVPGGYRPDRLVEALTPASRSRAQTSPGSTSSRSTTWRRPNAGASGG